MQELTFADFQRTPQDIKKQTKFDAIAYIEHLVKKKAMQERKSYLTAKAEFLKDLAAQIGRTEIKSINNLKAAEYTRIEELLAPECEDMYDALL